MKTSSNRVFVGLLIIMLGEALHIFARPWSYLSDLFRSTVSRKSILALADQGVLSAANFVTGLIIGRTCSKEQFGFYLLGLTIVTFAMSVQGFLICTPYTLQSPSLKGSEYRRFTGSSLLQQMALSLSIILFLVISRGVLVLMGEEMRGILTVVDTLIFAGSFVLLWDYLRRITIAAMKMKRTLLIDCSVVALQLASLLILAKSGLLSAALAFAAMGSACALVTLGGLFFFRGSFEIRFRQVKSDTLKNLSMGQWLFASGLLWSLTNCLYAWLLTLFHGAASAGVWAACSGVVALSNPLFMGMQNFLTPKIAHVYAGGEKTALRRFTLQGSLLLGFLILPFSIVLLGFGGELVSWLYGAKYAGHGLTVSLLSINFLVTSLSFSPSRALFAIGRADIDFKVNVVGLLIFLSIGIYLVKEFGHAGAAAALFISSITSLFLLGGNFHRLVREGSDGRDAR